MSGSPQTPAGVGDPGYNRISAPGYNRAGGQCGRARGSVSELVPGVWAPSVGGRVAPDCDRRRGAREVPSPVGDQRHWDQQPKAGSLRRTRSKQPPAGGSAFGHNRAADPGGND